MQNFAHQYPWLYEKFVTGFDAVISQSDHHWCNLRSNLTFENWFGFLTSRRGISESVYDMWTFGFKDILSVHHAMLDLTVLAVKTSD